MEATLHRVKALASAGKKQPVQGDLLLRLFESEWFNEWMCLQYLFQNPQPGVEDYLCNKLFNMPEAAVERYLLQFVYLAVSRPGSALERTIIALCAKSFSIALKVHWLLLALCQDQVKSKHVENLKDRCERAALEGQWEVPFRVTRLDPLSPLGTLSPEASGMMSPILSPLTQAPINLIMASSPPGDIMPLLATPGILMQIDESGEHGVTSPMPTGGGSSTPLISVSPALSGSQLFSASSGTPIPPPPGLHINTSPPYSGPAAAVASHAISVPRPHRSAPGSRHHAPPLQERMYQIRAELGDGEGVTALLHKSFGGAVAVAEDDTLVMSDDEAGGGPGGGYPPATPVSPLTRVRHDTYGATLDFMDTLCEASSSLASISQEERQRALRHTLEAINRELDKTVRRDIAVWFPMGRRNERVLRITAKEAVLLNSREKAPFMLFVEVLLTEDGPVSSPPTPPLPSSYSQPGLPYLPGASLQSIQGSLTSMSPYLANLVGGGGSGPQPSLMPPSTTHTHPAQEEESATAGPAPTGSAGGNSPNGTGNGETGGSLVPSTATSSGLACSVATSHDTRGGAPGGTPSPAASPLDSPDVPTAPAAASSLESETSLPKAMTGHIAAALEAINGVFRGRESTSQSGAAAAAPPSEAPPSIAPSLTRQSSTGSLYSVQDFGNGSSGSLPGLAGSGGSVVIPHRRRQTAECDQSNGSQGFTSLGMTGVLPATTSPVMFLGGSHGGITSAAEVAAAGISPTHVRTPASHPGSRAVSSNGGTGAALPSPSAARMVTFPDPDLTPMPSLALQPTPAPPPSPPEPSGWANALSTITRVLMPSSSTSGSLPVPSPPTGAAPAGAAQYPLPPLQLPDAAERRAGSLELRPPSPLSQQDLVELIQSGALPDPATGASGPTGSIGNKIAGALASLRGEAPLVRLQLRVLPAAFAAESAPARPPRGASPAPPSGPRLLPAAPAGHPVRPGSAPRVGPARRMGTLKGRPQPASFTLVQPRPSTCCPRLASAPGLTWTRMSQAGPPRCPAGCGAPPPPLRSASSRSPWRLRGAST